MSTLTESLGEIKKPRLWIAAGGAILLVWGAIAFPSMNRATIGTAPQIARTQPAADFYAEMPSKAKPVAVPQQVETAGAERSVAAPAAPAAPGADARKIIRTSSLEMVVQRPAEAAEQITSLAESLGGYLVSADGGGQNATAGMLTIRIPAARFEEARAAIRKLGLRVESEKIDAQDVSRR